MFINEESDPDDFNIIMEALMFLAEQRAARAGM